MLKKTIIFVLVIALFCSMSITGFASGNTDFAEKPPEIGIKMTYIQQVSTKLTIAPNGLSRSTAKIYAYSGVDSVRISMYLQRYNNGWETVKHWSQNFSGTIGSLNKTWYVTSGYNYRVRTYFYAYDGSDRRAHV